MPKCVYPMCKVEIASGGDSPPLFCEKHQGMKCVFPPCQETVIPNSGFCQVHNDMTVFFDFIHGDRHARAAQQMAAARQNQALVNRVMGKGNGGSGGLIIGRPYDV